MRPLRLKLGLYLRRTRRVVDRCAPLDELRPLSAPDDPIARLEARGLVVRRGRGNLADLPAPADVALERSLSEALEEQREDRV